MKKILGYIFLLIVVAFGFLTFGKYPSYPFNNDYKEVNITYMLSGSDGLIERTFTLEKENIEELQKTCSPVWVSPIAAGSMDGFPCWYIELIEESGRTKRYFVNEDEFHGTMSPPERLIKLLIEKYS